MYLRVDGVGRQLGLVRLALEAGGLLCFGGAARRGLRLGQVGDLRALLFLTSCVRGFSPRPFLGFSRFALPFVLDGALRVRTAATLSVIMPPPE